MGEVAALTFPLAVTFLAHLAISYSKRNGPDRSYCSSKCRTDQVKRTRRAKRVRTTKRTYRIISECKRCEHSFVKEHSRQEYCTVCGPVMSSSKGRREHEEATINLLVEERMVQEGWGGLMTKRRRIR